jgi:hypothetical protein
MPQAAAGVNSDEPSWLRNRVKKDSSSFLKKRTKKLLRIWARSLRNDLSQNNQKFFQKERLASGPPGINHPSFSHQNPALSQTV